MKLYQTWPSRLELNYVKENNFSKTNLDLNFGWGKNKKSFSSKTLHRKTFESSPSQVTFCQAQMLVVHICPGQFKRLKISDNVPW